MNCIKIGSTIIDNNGRKGVITEVRYKWVPAHDGLGGFVDGDEIVCVFARPADRNPVESIVIGDVRGGLYTDTAWHIGSDGNLHGMWVDSPLGSELTATVEECA